MEILDFLKEWSPVIVPGLIIFLDLLILILKNRPRTLDDFSSCLEYVKNILPDLIVSVEHPGDGQSKKNLVIKGAAKVFSRRFGRDLSVSEYNIIQKAISEQIEIILSTPQKKGGSK